MKSFVLLIFAVVVTGCASTASKGSARYNDLDEAQKTAGDSWISCSKNAAAKYAVSTEIPSEVAEAALGECSNLEQIFEQKTYEFHLAQVSTQAGQTAVRRETKKFIRGLRSDLKGSLMAQIINSRLKHAPSK